MIPCIPGVTELQEAGRNLRLIGFAGKQDNREVIVEIFRQESGEQDWFFRSAALQSRLAQAAIPTFLEVGWVEGQPYRLREYVQGRPAQQLLSDGPLAEERLVALARSLAAALKALHQRGFVHGALTIDHLRVDRSGVFRLLDAGRCESIGTPFQAKGDEYTAPELLAGGCLHPSADLYSLGAILLDLAVGYPVSDRKRALEYLEIRPALRDLLTFLLQEDAGRRPSASSLRLALVELEKREAALRLGQSPPALASEYDLHPYPLLGLQEELGSFSRPGKILNSTRCY